MKILGIETSCDETGISLIEATGEFGASFRFTVLGNGLISQAQLHAQYGGVFPNLAKREHGKNLVPILEHVLGVAGELKNGTTSLPADAAEILRREIELFALFETFASKYEKPQIDAIAVTYGPGLEPALWVGINFAKALAKMWHVPIVGVDHMEGHILISTIQDDEGGSTKTYSLFPFTYPVLALLISGGHTELVLSRAFGEYEILGATRDDAAGEAFDKVARLLNLPYPGGPEISRLAAEAREKHLQFAESLTRPMMSGYDFSFSGLKTAVRRIVESRPEMTEDEKIALAREFEDTVADVLVEKTVRAIDEFGVSAVIVGGGVSANTHIRAELRDKLQATGCKLLIPPTALATDNALMIALAGYFRAVKKEFADPETLRAVGNLKLGGRTLQIDKKKAAL